MDDKQVMEKKAVIFFHPLSDNLAKLKEVLSQEQDLDILEVHEIGEGLDIFGTIFPALWICSNPKIALQFMVATKGRMKKMSSKMALLSNVQLSDKITRKIAQLGLKDIINEPISPKSLLYKVNLLIRSLPSLNKKSDESRPQKNPNKNSEEKKEEEGEKKEWKVEKLISEEAIPEIKNVKLSTSGLLFSVEDSKNGNANGENSLEIDSMDIDPKKGDGKSSKLSVDDEATSAKSKRGPTLGLFQDELSPPSAVKGKIDILSEEKNSRGPGVNLQMTEDNPSSRSRRKDILQMDDSPSRKMNSLFNDVESSSGPIQSSSSIAPLAIPDDQSSGKKGPTLQDLLDEEQEKKGKNARLSMSIISDDATPINSSESHNDMLEISPESGRINEQDPFLFDEDKGSSSVKSPSGPLNLSVDDGDVRPSSKLFNDELNNEEYNNSRLPAESLSLFNEESKGSVSSENNVSLVNDTNGLQSDSDLFPDFDRDKRSSSRRILNLPDDSLRLGLTNDNSTTPLALEEEEGLQNRSFEDIVPSSGVNRDSRPLDSMGVLANDEKLRKGNDDPLLLNVDDSSSLKKSSLQLEIEEENSKLKKDSNTSINLLDNDEYGHKDRNLDGLVIEDGPFGQKGQQVTVNDDSYRREKLVSDMSSLDYEKKDILPQLMDIDGSWDFIKKEVANNWDQLSKKDKEELYINIEKDFWKKDPSIYGEIKARLEAEFGNFNSFKEQREDGRPISSGIDNTGELVSRQDSVQEEKKINGNKVFDPDTKGIEFAILVLEKMKNRDNDGKSILHFLMQKIYDEKKGVTHFLTFDSKNNAFNEICSFKDYHTTPTIDEFVKMDWQSYKSKSQETWSNLAYPKWSDETFQSQEQEFLFPIFEGVTLLGIALVHLKHQINEKEAKSIETILECSRTIFLDKEQISSMTSNRPNGSKENPEGLIRRMVRKAQNWLSGLFS